MARRKTRRGGAPLGVPHKIRRPVPGRPAPLRQAYALATLALQPDAPSSNAELARRYLEGRSRAVASVLVRAGHLLHDIENSPALRGRLPAHYLDDRRLSWRFLQETVRSETTAETLTDAMLARLSGAGRVDLAARSTDEDTPRGSRFVRFLYEVKHVDGVSQIQAPGTVPTAPPDAMQLVTDWLRWVEQQSADFARRLQLRRGAAATAFATASAGGSLQMIQARLSAPRETPADVRDALACLTEFERAMQAFRRSLATERGASPALSSPTHPIPSPAPPTRRSAFRDDPIGDED